MEDTDSLVLRHECCSSRQLLDALFGESRLAKISYEAIFEMCAGDLLCAATLGPASAWRDADGVIDDADSEGMLAKLLVRMPDAAKPDGVERICRWLRAVADWMEYEASGAADEDTARTRAMTRDLMSNE